MLSEMPITIKHATADDADCVTKLIHDLLTELSGGGPVKDLHSYTSVCRDLLASDGLYDALLALDGGEQPVGVLTLSECVAVYAMGRFGEISEFYVTPDYRSAGLGQELLESAVEFGRSGGWSRLEVGAPDLPRWARTVQFYQANGFSDVGPRLKKLLS